MSMNSVNTTTEDVLRGVGLSGKLVVVMGASGSLGLGDGACAFDTGRAILKLS
jgi:hypothetical protein